LTNSPENKVRISGGKIVTRYTRGHTIHSGDGLQKIVLVQALIDIHHLLNGRVKAGQQHVAHYQEGYPGQHLLRIVEIERFAEVVNRVPAFGFHTRLGDLR
jgi:hypothetical protein